jgi:voltage-gated potassium channel
MVPAALSGRFTDLILLDLILLSVLLVMMEKGFDSKYHDHLVPIEWLITGLFIEYLLRMYHKHTKPYIFSFMVS